MFWVFLLLSLGISVDCQKQQWQVVTKSSIRVFFPSVTTSQVQAVKLAHGLPAVISLCEDMASSADQGCFDQCLPYGYNSSMAQTDCTNYFNHRLSLQRYVNYLFKELAINYLTRFKSAELKSLFWNQDKKSLNQFDVTYCAFMNEAETLIFGTNRAKFFEQNVNISQAYKSYSLNDYYNVFFYRLSTDTGYPIADAADNCLYNFGQRWGFGSYASQFAG